MSFTTTPVKGPLMTVLQQVRNYYSSGTQPMAETKKMIERIMTPEGLKNHPSPQDYYAARQDDKTAPAPVRLLSQQA